MKSILKSVFFLTLLFCLSSATGQTNQTYSQLILGTWNWQSTNGKNNFELYLVQNGNSIVGKHCGSFYEGSKLDCILEDDEHSITLTQISSNIFEGNLNSGYSDITIPIRITLNPSNETISFQQLSQPIGEYYLPNNVTMTLAQ